MSIYPIHQDQSLPPREGRVQAEIISFAMQHGNESHKFSPLEKIYANKLISLVQLWNNVRTNDYQINLKDNPKLDLEDLENWFLVSNDQAKSLLDIFANYSWGIFNENQEFITLYEPIAEKLNPGTKAAVSGSTYDKLQSTGAYGAKLTADREASQQLPVQQSA